MTTCLLRRPTVPTLPPGAGEALSDLDLVAGLVLEYRGQPPGTGQRRRLDLARTSEGLQPRHDVRSQRKCRARRSSSDQLKMEFGRLGLCPRAGSVANSPKPTRILPGFVAGPAGEARLTNKERALPRHRSRAGVGVVLVVALCPPSEWFTEYFPLSLKSSIHRNGTSISNAGPCVRAAGG